VSDHYQTAGKAETISGTGGGAFVREVFGDLFESTPHQSVEGLQKKDGLTDAIE
jgi:hypothetical protein